MKILVTGGAGFIGSHLTDRLLGMGHGVVVLDNLSTGDMANLAGAKDHQNFEMVIGSVRDSALVQELVEQCDAVIHLAAAVGVKLILEKPSLSIHTNVNGTENILHAAANGNKLVIIASTSEVYGKAEKVPFSEEDDLVLGATANLRWSYAVAKMLDESLALSYSYEKRIRVIIVRLFNTTGPRQTGYYGMVLPNFVSQALKGAPITVHGTGDQSRCFGHVYDAVESLTRLLNAPNAIGHVFNVGNDEEVSIYGLAEKIKQKTGSKSGIVKKPYKEVYGFGFEDMQRRVPDVRKLETFIGYRPRTSLDQIIDDVIAEQREGLGLTDKSANAAEAKQA
ncbi:MAG: GDP-mannose 4,6-dehydratase [Sphingobium sp.]